MTGRGAVQVCHVPPGAVILTAADGVHSSRHAPAPPRTTAHDPHPPSRALAAPYADQDPEPVA
nr:hypothetical protein [Streptomyces antibioticus]